MTPVTRIRLRFVLSFMIFLAFVSIPIQDAAADQFFNSSEPGCNPANPNPDYYFCDDFEDGNWAQTNADTSGGRDNPANDGWGLTIYGTWPDPQGTGYGRCGGKGAVGTNCTATSGFWSGDSSNGIMGKHWFAPNDRLVEDIYFRYYLKRLPGFVQGHQKMVVFQNDQFSPSYQCCFLDTIFSDTCGLATDSNYDTGWMTQNQGNNICLQPGNWYYIEYHIKLNTPGQANGVMELWVDNCGQSGLGCTGPGTLRTRYTNRVFRDSVSQKIEVLWLENWANPGSSGEEYYDQMIASSKRIGPMGASADTLKPAAPTVRIK